MKNLALLVIIPLAAAGCVKPARAPEQCLNIHEFRTKETERVNRASRLLASGGRAEEALAIASSDSEERRAISSECAAYVLTLEPACREVADLKAIKSAHTVLGALDRGALSNSVSDRNFLREMLSMASRELSGSSEDDSNSCIR